MSSKNKQYAINELSENELLTLYRNGDKDAFHEVVNRHKRLVYTFLRHFVDDPEVVEYVFQETFLQLYTGRDSFDTDHPLRPWLITIAANRAKDVLRKKNHQSSTSMVLSPKRILSDLPKPVNIDHIKKIN